MQQPAKTMNFGGGVALTIRSTAHVRSTNARLIAAVLFSLSIAASESVSMEQH
jgi:hypothetical protein